MFAFVLMPFDASFDDIYTLGVKETAKLLGITAERVDEQIFHKENILERIYNQINSADFIISDMTSRNPNVFYETGYAHAKGKTCLLLTSNADDIPFDLKHHRHIIYGNSIQKLRQSLEADLASIKAEMAKSENGQLPPRISDEHEGENALSADTTCVLVHLFRMINELEDRDVGAMAQALGMERGLLEYHLDRLDEAKLAETAGGNYLHGHVYWALTALGRRYVVERKL